MTSKGHEAKLGASPADTRSQAAPAANVAPAEALRSLPSVGALLNDPSVQSLISEHGHSKVAHAARNAVSAARHELQADRPAVVSEHEIRQHLDRETRGSLVPVLNATGIVIHTNLGRAPLASQAVDAMLSVAASYSTLEYDLDAGERGDRSLHAVDLLTALTGAEAALVVNNNAAAVLLALSAVASGREVIVSRGELVEIGGGFRIPDVLAQSGARLVEVGTTNRTKLDDYANAISSETALLLKVHRSNFDLIGFTAEVGIAELAGLAREKGLPLFYDAGSGSLLPDLLGPVEVPVSSVLRAGANVVTFSGDKLLGGPQAGVIVGDRQLLATMQKHPLMRALRPDKLCLAALRATLLLLRDAPDEVPVIRMLRTPVAELAERAERLARALESAGHSDIDVVATVGRVGGGAAPSRELESRAVRISVRNPDELCRRLRLGTPPVIARIEQGATLLDLRCIATGDDAALASAVLAALSN